MLDIKPMLMAFTDDVMSWDQSWSDFDLGHGGCFLGKKYKAECSK